jgi:hypothetical protein
VKDIVRSSDRMRGGAELIPKVIVRLALASSMSATLAGCIPARLLESPGVTGTVVDSVGMRPVPGAQVRLAVKSSVSGKGGMEQSATTDESGNFSIAPKKVWSFLIAGADYFPLQDTLDVTAPGYDSANAVVRWSVTGKSSVPVGLVLLGRSAE